MKKVIFENPEVCNFGEQGVWFGEVSDSFDDVVTDRNVTTEAEALEWIKENYVGEFEVIIHQ